MRWTLVLVACACLGLFLATGRAEAQQPPGAPTIGSVTAGTNTLTVSWSAPAESGGTPITAYDLQYIRTDDDETDPANWTPLANVWTTGGTLQHVVGDLLDGLSYDLQVRARNSEGSGDWSDTHAASTNDHDFATSRSSLVALGSSLPGYIASGAGADADDDTFRISVPPGGGYLWVYTTGEVDTNGVLAAGNRDILDRNEDGWLPHGVRNFSIRHSVGDGTYYFRVQGQRGSTGAYRVHARLVTLPGATAATAQTVTLGEPALGRIQLVRGLSEDNYFTFTLTATTDVAIMASGFVDVIGELRDSGQTVLGSENGSGFLGADGFLLRRSLPADTYYVRVRARAYNGAGPYVLLIDEAGDAGGSSSVAATPLPFGHPQVARISSDTEEDYYRFTLDAETYVRFLAQPLGDSFALEATLYDDQNTDLSAYTVDRADYARHGEPYAAGILEKLEAGTYTLRIKAPSGETGGPYLVFAQVDTDQAAIIAGCKATTDAQTNALTDPLSGCQWPVKNTNQYGGDGDDINIESVWAAGKLGAGVNIAIVDNGIHAGHEDLVDNIVAARNHDYYGFGPDALATHGTQVAGLIAARDNDIGIRGVAPRASIYVYNLTADEDKIADNEADAMTRNMADTAVSNNSWSFPDDGDLHSPTAAWEEAVERGVTEGFGGKGVFYVWAAGNGGSEDNSNLDGRANFYAVTAACATGWRNRITDHSERGSNLWVCAPAGYSSELRVSPLVTTTTTGHRYTRNQGGTSAAAAIVSGVAALVRAENPDLTWRDVKLILAASASRNNPVHGKWEQGARKYRSTSQRYWYSHNYGFGTVDAAAAVGLAAGWTTNVPPLRTVEAASGPVDTPLEDAIVEDIRPGSTVSSTITLPDGYVEFIEFIEVEVTMAHPSVRDLRIVLESPSGAVSVLSTAVILDHQSPVFDGSFRFGSARHLGEDPGGTWTLRVTDRLPGHSGTFASWKIKAYGHSETAGYPPAPTATSGMRTLTIDWDAPTDIGGSAITSYDLRYIRDASGKTDPANWTELAGIGTDDTGTYEITGLGPGVQYDVQVRAVNDTGPGPWSESLVVRSPLEQPFAPSLTGVTPRDQGLGATWDAPTEDGGSEITSYDLRSSDATDTEKLDPNNWTETPSAWRSGDGDLQGRVASLTNGVEYDVQVRARNAIDVGDWSETLKGMPAIQNTDPTFADDTATREVAESLPVGVNVGARVSATDPDRGDPLTYSILGGHNLFEIDATNGQLRTKVELEADEGVTSHTLTVEVSDMLNSSDDVDTTIDDTIEVTVAVTNVNEPPMVEGTTAIDHAENEGTALANASYSATDPEGATIIWSLSGIDKDFFAISSGGVLSFAAEPDFDARPLDDTYEVTVRATEEDDGDPLTRELPGTLDVIVTLSNFDEPPEIDGEASVVDYPENSPTTTVVGRRYTATDPEGAGVTWSDLSGNDADKFELSNTGVLTFKASPDYEMKHEYEVTVNASDGMLPGSLDVTVTIADVNEPPMVEGTTAIAHAENNGTALANASYSATDPEGANIIWSVGGDDKGFFAISSGGVLSFAAEPDFDARPLDNTYEVTVRATEEDDGDADPLTGTLAVTVTLTDFDEPPEIDGPVSVVDYPENSPTTKIVGSRYMAKDPEGAGVTWSDLAGNDAGKFEFSNTGVLTFKVSPNFEQQPEYEVTLNAFDGGLTGRLTVTVTIADVNEPPVVRRSSGTGAFSIAENSGTDVGAFEAMDPEGQGVTWSLATTGDHARFEIDAANGALSFKELPDYESSDIGSDKAYNVTVRATEVDDGDTQTLERTGRLAVTVAVTDVNEPPTVTENATPSVDENTTAVATYRATDPDERATITWSVEDPGASDFTITNAGALSFASAPNYEVKSSYTVTVRASDGTNDVDHDVTVTVTDVDETEVLTLSHRTPLIGEEFTAAFKGTGDNVDNVQVPTWAWARSAMGSSSGWMPPITDATNATYEPTGDDRERYLRVTVSYDDGHGAKTLSKVSDFTTKPDSGTNTPPTFPDPLFTGVQMGLSVRENAGVRTVVGVAPEATDMQGGTLRYSLAVAGFTSGPPFGINATSRQIRVVRAVLDHEDQDSYSVTVTVVDEFDATATATFDITILDVNDRPVAGADSATTREDMAVTFGVLGNDTDQDGGDTLAVTSTTQPRRGSVVLDTNTQMLTYTPAENDHDTYTFTYRATDGTLSSEPAQVTVTVTSVNDPPKFETEMTTRTVSESAQPGDEVGTKVEATDVDDITLTYSLSGASEFEIVEDTGQIQVAPGVTLDRERTPSYEVTVTASDGKGGTDSIDVTIDVSDVPEPPTAVNDTAMTAEDTRVNIDVLDNDTDPDTERARLRVSVLTQPLNGTARAQSDQTITYTPNANFAGPNSFTYRVSDGRLTDDGSVSVTVVAVNDAPTFFPTTAARSVPEDAEAHDNVGAPVTATDIDNAMLTYRLSGADSGSFNIDSNGQIAVATGVTFDIATQETYVVTVTADDGSGEANATATVEVTITVTAGPVIIITGGGGGGGGGGPSPSEVDFEWTVKRDIEELDGGNDRATGVWSDGTTLWVADNADGAGDAVYAYDRETGERVEEREFTLHETNRAPRGFWSDRSVVWVSDSGQERLFAYRLADGERLEEREFALAERNADARGIWSDEETMWVLDSRAGALFAYGFESGELLAEYELDAANDDPRGIWSDGVTIWVSDHGAKRLIAYRLPVLPDAETDSGEEDADDDARELERVRDEEFTELSKASNNSPRGIWSDGDVMYVADESDDRVYSYNMPDAIDARLASLTLSGVDIGEFDPGRPDYEAVVADGVTETSVEAEAAQDDAVVDIAPADADGEADGHQVALQDLGEITVTVTSADDSRTRVYRVRFPETGWDAARDPWPHCLRGAVSEGFSLVVFEGGSVEELVSCAESRDIVALYMLHEGVFVSYILGAPGFVNAGFLELFPDGLPPITPLIATSNGPPSADPFGDLDDGGQQPWPECLRGDIATGFSLVVHEGGSVEELVACAEEAGVAALYALSEGEFVSYILGAPEFVNARFVELFAGGVPPMTPLVARSEGLPDGR